jgi:tetratricopeptide (TPR) repeat protein
MHLFKHIFLSTCLLMSSFAYSNKADSLQVILRKEKSDTARAALLAQMGFEYWSSSQDSLYKYEQSALKLAEMIDFEKGKIRPLYGLGIYYWQKGKYDSAFIFYQKSQQLARKFNDVKSVGDCYSAIGNLHREKGEHSEAQKNFLKALKEYEKINFVEGKARMLSSTFEKFCRSNKNV